MKRLIDDPSHWRKCAFEARAKAVHMETEERRRIMLRIADEYLLAIRAEERIQQNELMAA
jgi:hypothetical protein